MGEETVQGAPSARPFHDRADEAIALATGLGLAVQWVLSRLVRMLEERRLLSGEDLANDLADFTDFLKRNPAADPNSTAIAGLLTGLVKSMRADRQYLGPPHCSAPPFKLRTIAGGRSDGDRTPPDAA